MRTPKLPAISPNGNFKDAGFTQGTYKVRAKTYKPMMELEFNESKKDRDAAESSCDQTTSL